MPNQQVFEKWWAFNKDLFQAEFQRQCYFRKRQSKNVSTTAAQDEIWEEIKNQVYHETFLAETIDGKYQNVAIAEMRTRTAQCDAFIDSKPKIIRAKPGKDQHVASKLSSRYRRGVNEDGYKSGTLNELENCSDDEIRLILTQTFMELMNKTEGNVMGAVTSLVVVHQDNIYVMSVGDAPVYLTSFDDENPINDKTIFLNRLHDATDYYERERAKNQGAELKKLTNDANVAIYFHDPETLNGVQPSRTQGDAVLKKGVAYPIPAVSGLPTLSVYKKPKNGHLLVCSDGISKILDPKDINKVARTARNENIHNIAHTLVELSTDSQDDNTAMDVPLNQGCVYGLVTDGHNVEDKEYKNPVVAIIENNIDPLLKDSAKAIKQVFNTSSFLQQMITELHTFLANTFIFSRVYNNTNTINKHVRILEDINAQPAAKNTALNEIFRIFAEDTPSGASYTLKRLVKNAEFEQKMPAAKVELGASSKNTTTTSHSESKKPN